MKRSTMWQLQCQFSPLWGHFNDHRTPLYFLKAILQHLPKNLLPSPLLLLTLTLIVFSFFLPLMYEICDSFYIFSKQQRTFFTERVICFSLYRAILVKSRVAVYVPFSLSSLSFPVISCFIFCWAQKELHEIPFLVPSALIVFGVSLKLLNLIVIDFPDYAGWNNGV